MPNYMLLLRGDATADYSEFTPETFGKSWPSTRPGATA